MNGRAGKQRQRSDGRHVWAFGLRMGYWPCLRGVFAKLDFGPVFIELCISSTSPPWWRETKGA